MTRRSISAFSTASSEAAYPRTLERLEEFGVSNRIASFTNMMPNPEFYLLGRMRRQK